MAKPQNFLDYRFDPFTDRVHEASMHGGIKMSDPLVNALARAQEIARGAAVIARMHVANGAQADAFGDGSDKTESPPVCGFAMSALMGLVAAACEAIVNDIDGLAGEVDKQAAEWKASTSTPKAKVAS